MTQHTSKPLKSLTVPKTKTPQQQTEKLRKKCVALAKQIAKERDGYKCQYCGVGKPQRQVHSHHIFHEGLYKSMSADPDNLITICAAHHMAGKWIKATGFNIHGSPRESTEWLMGKYPERYAKLKKRSQKITKLDERFWQRKLEALQHEIELNQ